MYDLIILRNNSTTVEKISILSRRFIKQEHIQNILKKYYENKSYIFKCSCKKEEIFMHLKRNTNYITISSNPTYGDKHELDCIFNLKIIEINAKYYNYEKDIFTTNIFFDKETPDKLNKPPIEYDNISRRLSSVNIDDTEQKNIYSKSYARYRNYNDFCISILEEVLSKIYSDTLEKQRFINTCKWIILNKQVNSDSKNTTIGEYIKKFKKTYKQLYFQVEILENKSDILELQKLYLNNSQIEFLNNIFNSSIPILVIYFKKKQKITSLFGINVKLITKIEKHPDEKLKLEKILLNQNTLLKENILIKVEKEEKLNFIKNETESIQISKAKLEDEIRSLDVQLKETNELPDKKWIFKKNEIKFKRLNILNEKIKSLKKDLELLENLINSKKEKSKIIHKEIEKLKEEIQNIQSEINEKEILIKKPSFDEIKLVNIKTLKQKISTL